MLMLDPMAFICSLVCPSVLWIVLAISWIFGDVGFLFFKVVIASLIICLVGQLPNWVLIAIAGE
jgi:hypothetical protein